MHGIFREKLLKFTIKLGGQSFIMTEYECWPAVFGNDIRHGKCFTGTSNAKKGLLFEFVMQALVKFIYSPRLVT